MKKMTFALAAFAATMPLFASGTAQAADTITYNSAPSAGWHYGDGNNYSPSNSAILTTDDGDELALRLHERYQTAPASDGAGVYSFSLGTLEWNIDWGIETTHRFYSALITLTNMTTGATSFFNPRGILFFIDNDRQNNSLQDSDLVNNPFVSSGLGFDPNINNTYKVNLTVNGLHGETKSLDAYAKFGLGAGAVPEPGVWAMMIFGFGLIGGTMRRRSPVATLAAA